MGMWIGVAILLFLVAFWQQREARVKKYSDTRILFGSFVTVEICVEHYTEAAIRNAVNDVWKRLEDLNVRLNVYNDESEIAAINRSAGQQIQISPDLYSLLRIAVTLSNQTDGAFDITVKPLVKLWSEYGQKGELPPSKMIQKARIAVGSENIEFFPDHTIRLSSPEVQIDLGAIAEGYALDEAAKILRMAGIQDFFVNIGGDIYASGHNCEGDRWRVGIKDPRQNSTVVDIVGVSNFAITTSGSYEKFYEIRGRKYSHEINPITGYPANRIVSATVIAPSGVEADAFSTALCVMEENKGLQFINKKDNDYASLVISQTPTGKMSYRQSRNYLKFKIKSEE